MTIPTVRGIAATEGSLSISDVIDFNREHNPNASYFVYAPEDGSDGTASITHLEFGRAADRVAHIVRPGGRGAQREVVAVVALSDTILYQAIVIGIIRAGHIPFPMSPRNTAAAIIKLMKDSSCHRILTTRQTLGPLISQVEAQFLATEPDHQILVEEVPSLVSVFPNLGREAIDDAFTPYSTGRSPANDETAMYLHSSGSTSLPKAIRHSFRTLSHWSTFPPITDLRDHPKPQIMAVQAAPCFHTMGVQCQLLIPLYGLVPVAIYPPTALTPTSHPITPSPQNILDHARRTSCTCLAAVPTVLQAWLEDDNAIKFLASLDFVPFGGASLPSRIGNRLAEAGVYLCSVYGTTETGVPAHYFRDPELAQQWEYFRFSDKVKLRWMPQGDGTFEGQFLTCDTHQVSVENLDDVRGYNTKDLFVRHPTKPDYWKAVGRKDDVIVHTSGEKTVPAPMEDIMMGCPSISGCVMFGREHDQAGVLIELKQNYAVNVSDEQEVARARELIWPYVEEANAVCPAFSRIFKELVLIVSKDKPLPRAGKGSIMRKAAVNLYDAEIEEIYTKLRSIAQVGSASVPESWSSSDVQTWLLKQVVDVRSGKGDAKPVSIHDDLFEQGLDSLSATILRRRILGALHARSNASNVSIPKGADQHFSPLAIYDNPTVQKLTQFLLGLVDRTAEDTNTLTYQLNIKDRVETIEHMIEKYARNPSTVSVVHRDDDSAEVAAIPGPVVLITGTTGNLGSQLLEALLKAESVARVYAFNRRSYRQDTKRRNAERFKDKCLDQSVLNDPRLTFLEGDLTDADLGQQKDVYDELLKHVNVVIHNAWKLDFNLSLSSFEANIRGTRNLIDFARSSRYGSSVKFLFTSSISVAGSWQRTLGSYPEEIVQDPQYAIGTGYGESKYVAERILSQSGLDVTSFRISQITGAKRGGAWASSDWVPILIKTSVALGSLPSCIGTVSWLPMDAVAQSILDVALTRQGASDRQLALNVVHPRPVTWDTVFAYINGALVKQGIITEPLPLLKFEDWITLLEGGPGSDSRFFESLPALKIIHSLRRMAETDASQRLHSDIEGAAGGVADFATSEVEKASATIQSLPLLDSEDAAAWVGYWRRTGLFVNGSP